MNDEKDRLGETLRQREKAIEDSWAHQQDEEIIARLRKKYTKPIKCPICGEHLDARTAISLGGMACPTLKHGAWLPAVTLEALRVRLANAEAAYHAELGGRVFEGVKEIVEDLRKAHPKEIDCPDCGARLKPRAAKASGEAGLGGMACPHDHGAWLDHATVEKIRARLDMLEKRPAR